MKQLFELRKSKKLTQLEVAKMLEITDATLSNYELGNTEPNIATLKKMAETFQVSVDYLVGHKTPGHLDLELYAPHIQSLMKKIPNLTDIECARMEGYYFHLMQERKVYV